jgi:16S rRNA (cytosine967-C5)-methyltransferase
VSEQARLLDALWPLLKPGGMLVYATCSVLKCENSLQIAQFLDRYADSAAAPMDGFDSADGEPGRQILPGERNMDGFYYARLVKSA